MKAAVNICGRMPLPISFLHVTHIYLTVRVRYGPAPAENRWSESVKNRFCANTPPTLQPNLHPEPFPALCSLTPRSTLQKQGIRPPIYRGRDQGAVSAVKPPT